MLDASIGFSAEGASHTSNGQVNRASIIDCLARLAEAEKVLADVRCALTEACSPSEVCSASEGGLPRSRAELPVIVCDLDAELPIVAGDLDDLVADSFGVLEEENNPTTTVRYGSESAPARSKSKEATDEAACKEQFPQLAEAYNLSEDKVGNVYEIFTAANFSRTGLLNLDELGSLLVDMCDGTIEHSQLSSIMDKFDKDKDGRLNFPEFVNAFCSTPMMKASHLHDELKAKGGDARSQIQEAGIRLQALDWVQMMGCKTESVTRYVNKEISEAGSCLAMPLVFAMFVLFFLSSFLHLGYEQLHSVDKAIYFDIVENANFAFSGDVPFENGRMGHKNIYDVNSFSDFWSWFELGITPIFWAEGWELSETNSNVLARCIPSRAFQDYGYNYSISSGKESLKGCPADITLPERPKEFYGNAQAGTYLYYNSVVGGVRLRQERSIPEACPNEDDLLIKSLHRGQCVSDVGYFLEPELHSALRTDESLINRPGGETVYLPALASQSTIRSTLRKLEHAVWLSPHTAKVEILLTTYNAHLDIFTATYVWLFINRGGHMYKVLEPTSTYLTTYRQPVCYVVDILLLALCLKIVVEEGAELYKTCKRLGLKKGLREYAAPANFIDWFSVIYFASQMGFWIRHMGKIGLLNKALRNADPITVGSFSDAVDRDFFYDTVDDWVLSDNSLRSVLAVFPFILGMRFFKVFSLQPRLGVVTATLQSSFVDIAHFAMVFGSIFLVFVTAAMILFGQEIDDFTNFGRAMTTVFRIMLGDYDWSELIRIGRQQAAMWFWSFTWLVNLIMLNMLLAIIMDVYTEVKGHISADAETMWSQAAEIMWRWWDVKQGHQIRMETIMTALEKYAKTSEEMGKEDSKEEDRLTIASFMELVPSMPEHQAIRVLVSAYSSEEEKQSLGGSVSETSSRVQHILRNTRSLHDAFEHMMHMNEVLAELIQTNFAEMRYHSHRATKVMDSLKGNTDEAPRSPGKGRKKGKNTNTSI